MLFFSIGNNKLIQQYGDKRIFVSSEAIQGMKSLKLNCLEDLKIRQITELREKELTYLKTDSWLWSIMTFIASTSTLLLSSLILGMYGLFETQEDLLPTEDIFTILALLNQLTVCLSVFPVTLPIMIKAILSIKRLKVLFAHADKHQEEEEEKSIDTKDKSESENNSENSEKTPNNNAISLFNATYVWPYSDSSIAMSEVTTNIAKGSLTMVMSPDNSFFLG